MTVGLLTRAQIDAAKDLPTEDVEVPEWEGSVRLRVMTAGEQAAFFRGLAKANGESDATFAVRLVAACAIDETGGLLWPEGELTALGARNPVAIERLLEVAMRLNKMGRFEKGKLVPEDAEKN